MYVDCRSFAYAKLIWDCVQRGVKQFLPSGLCTVEQYRYVVLVGGSSHTTIQLQKLIKDRDFFRNE
jgi:hypothetical protein